MKPTDSQPSHILPEGTELPHNYIINKILGEGGFGITYSGILSVTGERVAIKEYFPNGLAHRERRADGSQPIIPFYGMEDSFEKGRQHFLYEASILREFQNLNSIVSVKDVIETNGTVYLVMEYIDGITLKQYVKENGALSFHELLPLMKPVIQALIQVHKQGLIHRDISPENLMIGIDNQLHLIDFGAASIENCHDDKTMTVILKSGYAPPEQYLSDGKQGAWTDIYALCATMYMTLTGFAPSESIRRIQQDELPPLAEHADITSWQAAAVEKGMNLNAANRFQNMESLYQALVIPPIEINSKRRSYQNTIEENKTIIKNNAKTMKHNKQLFIGILVAFLFVAIFIGTTALGDGEFSLFNFTKEKSLTSESTLESSSEQTSLDNICTMMDVMGDTYAEARKKINSLDSSILIKTEWVYDDTQPSNTVITQSVKPGTDFTKGSINTILLTVSKGSEPTTESGSAKDSTDNSSEESQNTEKSSSSDNKTTTSDKSTNNKSNFTIDSLDDDKGNFTIE